MFSNAGLQYLLLPKSVLNGKQLPLLTFHGWLEVFQVTDLSLICFHTGWLALQHKAAEIVQNLQEMRDIVSSIQ